MTASPERVFPQLFWTFALDPPAQSANSRSVLTPGTTGPTGANAIGSHHLVFQVLMSL